MYVYILANATNVAIHVGVTNDLVRRVSEHRTYAAQGGYTARYDITKLVYFEATPSPYAAITRKKQIKSWSRAKKNALISKGNPRWDDLFPVIANQSADWCGNPSPAHLSLSKP